MQRNLIMAITSLDLGLTSENGIRYRKGATVLILNIPEKLKTTFPGKSALGEDIIVIKNGLVNLKAKGKKNKKTITVEFFVEEASIDKQLTLNFSEVIS